MQNEQLKVEFEKVYNNLNAAQKDAVQTIDGPVMVIAGPGTGKTQILSARIANILLQTDAYPQNILCLTFTDAGVVAMRKRLLKMIGADAYKVNICTYHTFCNDVIQGNLHLFNKNILEPITDLESVNLFRKLIDNFEKGHPLKRYRGDVYFDINGLKHLFATLKKEGWEIDYIIKRIDQYITELPTTEGFYYKRKYKQFEAGDPKQPLIDAEIEKATKIKAALGEYEKYNQLMHEAERYDFNDMINWVINAFETNPNLLAQYQEQYQYILVDEFQDSSGTQNKIVQLLINYWDKPNVFVVGDDDQSIYRFQGAEVENMEAFAEVHKKDLKRIVLENNYRSIQPILDIAKKSIEINQARLVNKMPDLTKELITSKQELIGITTKPNIISYDTMHHEMIAVTLEVEKLISNGVLPGNIAIIYKENKYGDELSNYMHLKNIPYFSKRNKNLLDIPLTKKIIQVMRYLASELDITYSGDAMLFEILHYDWFNLPPITIAKQTIEVANARYQKDSKIHSIRQLINDKANQTPKDLFDEGLHPQLKAISIAIEQLLKNAVNETLQNVVQSIINELQVLAFVMKSSEKHWHLQVLTAFFNLVKQETHRNPKMGLKEFMEMVDTMEKEKINLPLYQINGTTKGINLLTCHGSKGLEFEYEFIVGCNAHIWEGKKSPNSGFNLSKYLQSSNDKAQQDVMDLEEMRRLFYVAITRAEKQLQISYFKYKDDNKDAEQSLFVAEIINEDLKVEEKTLNENAIEEFAILELSTTAKPIIAKLEEDIISRSLEKFAMNVTALNAYLNCPIGFYYKNLIRIPSPKNENAEFGSAIHEALDRLFKTMQDDASKNFPDIETVISYFNIYMRKHRESFTPEQFKKRMEYGPMILNDYYNKYVNQWNKVVAVERNIKGVVVAGVPLKGKVDKIEFDGKNVNVVDYKTGKYENAKKQFNAPNSKDENGGDYWRQAVFYKILIDNYNLKDWRVISTEFDFIEPDEKKQYQKEKIEITPQDITTVTQQIKMVWDKIQARDFYTGCGKEDCKWCNFVKDNKIAIGFDDEDEEENTMFTIPEEM